MAARVERYTGDVDSPRCTRAGKARIHYYPFEKSPPTGMEDFIPGALWWRALSQETLMRLLERFEDQEVGCVLYERIGAMKQDGVVMKYGRRWYRLWIQVQDGDWDTDLCLSEIGVILEEPFVENDE